MYAAKSGGRCAYLRYHDVLEARRRAKPEQTEAAHAQAGEGATEGHEAEPTA
jgi:hypothetical protein